MAFYVDTSATGMRSLDALHVAVALDLGDDLEGLVTYDTRLTEAAAVNGVVTITPVT